MAKALIKGVNDLYTLRPDLVEEWDEEANTVDIKTVYLHSNKSAHWTCKKCGNKYVSTVNHRTNGTGCPVCGKNKRIVSYKKNKLKQNGSLKQNRPDLVEEWNFQRNEIDPSEITTYNNEKFWWICKFCGNEWQSTPAHRANGEVCPVCSRKKAGEKRTKLASIENSISLKAPELIGEWDQTNDFLPSEVSINSSRSIKWICSKCGHKWKAVVRKRTVGGRGCPMCNFPMQTSMPEQVIFYYISKYFKDAENTWTARWLKPMSVDVFIPSIKLAIEYDGETFHKNRIKEDIAKSKLLQENNISLVRFRENKLPELHDGSVQVRVLDINKDLTLLNTYIKKLFDIINQRYSFDIIPNINIDRDYNEIAELFRRKRESTFLANKYPELLDEWNYEKNNKDPKLISSATKLRVWWKCPKGHEYKSSVVSRTSNKTNCPYCSNRKVLKGYNDLATTYPKLLRDWNFAKNGTLTPDKITYGSQKKVWWKCDKCGYEWQVSVAHRTSGKGHRCPACSNRKVLKGYNDLATTHPELVKEWHLTKNGNLTPYDVVAGCNDKVWWVCPICNHEYKQSPTVRVYQKTGCPVCAGRKSKQGYNDIGTLFPDIANEWHYERNYPLKPSNVTKGSHKKVWWKCENGHEWEAVIKSRTRNNGKGSNCPYCTRANKLLCK